MMKSLHSTSFLHSYTLNNWRQICLIVVFTALLLPVSIPTAHGEENVFNRAERVYGHNEKMIKTYEKTIDNADDFNVKKQEDLLDENSSIPEDSIQDAMEMNSGPSQEKGYFGQLVDYVSGKVENEIADVKSRVKDKMLDPVRNIFTKTEKQESSPEPIGTSYAGKDCGTLDTYPPRDPGQGSMNDYEYRYNLNTYNSYAARKELCDEEKREEDREKAVREKEEQQAEELRERETQEFRKKMIDKMNRKPKEEDLIDDANLFDGLLEETERDADKSRRKTKQDKPSLAKQVDAASDNFRATASEAKIQSAQVKQKAMQKASNAVLQSSLQHTTKQMEIRNSFAAQQEADYAAQAEAARQELGRTLDHSRATHNNALREQEQSVRDAESMFGR